mmetsp:Transcript_25077/g.54681  ORF Transcript_25077/g.54681 Transcript_25077/m.54681 type:complete len:369 (-) Transcript_25077:89-1195(-)
MVRIGGNPAVGSGNKPLGLFRSIFAFLAGVSVTVLVTEQRSTTVKDTSTSYQEEVAVTNQVVQASASSRDEDDASSTTRSTTFDKSFPDFFSIGQTTGTDKVRGDVLLPACRNDTQQCRFPEAVNPACRISGHFYHTLYNKWLRPYAQPDSGPMTFLEIGFYRGSGYDAYSAYLKSNPAAVLHSMEISCIEAGPRAEGKWPWGNFASRHARYEELISQQLLHCGDAADYTFLRQTWKTHLQTKKAPLRVVVDDAAHLAHHMATSLFFWFPRIAPGGILVVEDIEPLSAANDFLLYVLPKVLKDLHYCGRDSNLKEKICFPTIQPLLKSVHCEMHICVFERNSEPSWEPSREESLPPKDVLKASECLFH